MNLPFVSVAQAASVTPVGTIDLTKNYQTILGSVLSNVVDRLLFVAGAAAIIYLIWAGIQYISSAGNPDKIKLARAAIFNAIIGIAIITAAYGIINFASKAGGLISSGTAFPSSAPVTAGTSTPGSTSTAPPTSGALCPDGNPPNADGTCTTFST